MFHVSTWKATPHESQNWKIKVKFRYLHSTADKPQCCIQKEEDVPSCILQKNFTQSTFLDLNEFYKTVFSEYFAFNQNWFTCIFSSNMWNLNHAWWRDFGISNVCFHQFLSLFLHLVFTMNKMAIPYQHDVIFVNILQNVLNSSKDKTTCIM